LKYLILLISGSLEISGEIAEFDAKGAWVIGTDSWQPLA
jgi:hypothetical protein